LPPCQSHTLTFISFASDLNRRANFVRKRISWILSLTGLELLAHRGERVWAELQSDWLVGGFAEVAVGILVGTIDAQCDCDDEDGSHWTSQ
jgi:hypothetical protein